MVGTSGSLIMAPVPHDTTGLLLGGFTVLVAVNGEQVATPVATIGLALTEVDDALAPGLYYISFTPDREGTYYLRLSHTGDTYEYVVTVTEPAWADASLEGDYTLTVTDGLAVVEGATVRVYNAAGTRLVTRGISDAGGEVTFYGLPVGQYQVRVSKSGMDFSSINPTTITVVANADEAPIITDITPATVSIGDWIAIRGDYLGPATTEVLFSGTTVSAAHVSADGRLVLVQVPVGLTTTALPIRVLKDDPNDPPSGQLMSNIYTVILS
jgi:hypothetical protein